MRARYEKFQKNKYRVKKGEEGFVDGKAEYLEWDPMHKELEAYGANKKHLGSLETNDFKLYRDAKPGRKIKI